ncbi:MAG: hypothetical protein HY619_07305 [Thaumarchaeota archaeon]|nr:hypothetical protein [Nitrososphaerota archaeon]
MKVLLEAVDAAHGSISKLEASLPLPPGVVATLVSSAANYGFVSLKGDEIMLSESCSNALREGRIDSLFRSQSDSERCEWAMDTSTGLVHDFVWVLEHRKTVDVLGDLVLAQEVKTDQVPTLMKEMRLDDLIRVSSIRSKFTSKEDEPKITVENLDKIDELEVAETIEAAVPVTEHRSGEITRWMLPHDAPTSVIGCLIRKKPELFAIRYELKEGREKWAPSQASVLLESVDKLWEKVQDAQLVRTSFEVRKELARIALDELKRWKSSWKEEKIPYSDIKSMDVWSGPASKQGEELAKFMKRVRKRVVILTSFLNRKYVSWVAQILSNLPNDPSVLILYGHANEETPAEQNAEIQSYKEELLRHLRRDITLNVGTTIRRTHEKIVISDTSNCMVGSWNICSSNPNSEHLEVNVDLKSRNIAAELCSVLEEETTEKDVEFIKILRGSLEKTDGRKGREVGPRIDSLLWLMELIVKAQGEAPIDVWREWRIQLLGLRDILWTYFDSPLATVLTTESLRDVFVEQIRSSYHSLLIATDRVNPNGLDASLVQHLFEKERLIRIIWGIESPEWDLRDEPEVQEELNVAAETLSAVIRRGRENVLTSVRPMLNHSKLLIVDENRFMVSSSNFLARGTEPTEESSREIGILIESPLLARKLLGQLMLHSEPIRRGIELRQRVGQPWDLFELVRQALQELWDDKEIENPGRPDLVSFAVMSTFRESTEDGRIVGESGNLYKPLDISLSNRWEQCMKFFGKGRIRTFPGVLLQAYEENFFTYACEMIGIQRLWNKGSYTIHPRSRKTFVLLPSFLRKLGKSFKPPTEEESAEEVIIPDEEADIKNEMLYSLWIGRARDEA